eukprot:2354400-Ditylum_brightwellii.AAC.1
MKSSMYTSTYWRRRAHCSGVRNWYRYVKGWWELSQVWLVAMSAVAAGGDQHRCSSGCGLCAAGECHTVLVISMMVLVVQQKKAADLM